MKDKPIIFSTEMVKAILEGRKTQTRRIIKPQPVFIESSGRGRWEKNNAVTASREWYEYMDTLKFCPYQIGQTLIVAKEIPSCPNNDYCAGSNGEIYSRTKAALPNGRKIKCDWFPLKKHEHKKGYYNITISHKGIKKTKTVHSLICEAFYGIPDKKLQVRHLDGNPKNNKPDNLSWGTQVENWNDRKAHKNRTNIIYPEHELIPEINLEVTNIRVERLQDISDEDCWQEGIDEDAVNRAEHYLMGGSQVVGGTPERCVFSGLWDSINEKRGYGWDKNPYVWVIEFKRI